MTSLIKALKLLSMRLFVEKKPAAGTPTDTSAPSGTAPTGTAARENTADKSIYNHAPRDFLPRGAFSMYAPQEACGVVFDVKAIVPCRGFCVLAFDFCPPPEAGAGVSVRSPARAALTVLFRRVFLFP